MNDNPRNRKAVVTYYTTSQRSDKRQGSLPGRQLSRDLTQLTEDISSGEIVDATALSEPVWTTDQLAERMSVCKRTISRWRHLGLVGRKVRSSDGRVRVAFTEQSFQQFARQNSAAVRRGREFTRLTAAEKRAIVQRAKDLVQERHLGVHAVTRQVAEETGRSVETVRYTLRRHDQQHPTRCVLTPSGQPALIRQYAAVRHRLSAGQSLEQIAGSLECDVDRVREIIRHGEIRSLIGRKPKYVYNELFDDPNADAVILDVPEPARVTGAKNLRFSENRAWSAGALRPAPLLTREQEADLFRRYNYLKFKASRALEALKPGAILEAKAKEIRSLMNRTHEIRDRLIRCNLRLVVSIVKRFSNEPSAFSDLLSDGNMALMRAVETFDYARGNKLSTYATAAIVRTLIRTLAAGLHHAGRWVTASDERLQSLPDGGMPPESAAVAADLRRLLREGLSQLDDRERVVITRRFGLGNNGRSETLASIGRDYGVSKECIRQVQERALEHLRLSLTWTDGADLLDAA
jgi:RNA polymerase sigma factor (sigma-70 family)